MVQRIYKVPFLHCRMYDDQLPFKMLKVAGDEDISLKFTMYPNYEQ